MRTGARARNDGGRRVNTPDARREALQAWAAARLDGAETTLEPVSVDASFRRYFRMRHAGGSVIAMDAPPEREDSRPFVRVAALMREAGLHTPAIRASDLERGFLLLEDLGDRSYLDALDSGNADALFADAVAALIDWQAASRPGVLPEYDAALLRRELALFPDWFLDRHLGVNLSAAERGALAAVFDAVVARALEQPRVYVHRDYMPRNLMLSDPNPGVIDFQDAVYGPVAYDVLSVFKDAFVSWPAARVEAWTRDYWTRARARGLPVPADYAGFAAMLDWIGVQRHLKVLGIFARIRYRDGKPRYLEDAPRFVGYVLETAARWPELAPLARLFERYVTAAGADAGGA